MEAASSSMVVVDEATLKNANIVCYFPVHTSYSQVEHRAPFLERFPSKAFLYQWNTATQRMQKEYSDKQRWPLVERVLPFTLRHLFEQLREDRRLGRRVVFLLTASTNYGFGRAQAQVLHLIRSFFGGEQQETVVDVFPVGHCMFGCESCGDREHRTPLFFTRFFRGTLPYSTEDVRQRYFAEEHAGKLGVLICPSVGETSFLVQPKIREALIKLQEKLKDKARFFVKFHGFCYLEDLSNTDKETAVIHPLHSLTEAEREGVIELRKHFTVVPEEEYNILPFMDACRVIITDLNSSVPFEALYFSEHSSILAFDHRSMVHVADEPVDAETEEYRSHLHLFAGPEELDSTLSSTLTASEPQKKAGRKFFESRYGCVDGNEALRIAQTRGWFSTSKEQKEETEATRSEEEEWKAVKELVEKEMGDSMSPLDYLARGESIPQHVVEYNAFFLERHQAQLLQMKVPPSLWPVLYQKLKEERFDAGEKFQLGFDPTDQKLKLVVAAEEGVKAFSDIFLIDHAWTYTFDTARKQLEEMPPQLLHRMAALVGVSVEGDGEEEKEGGEVKPKEQLVEDIWSEMWKYNQTYRVAMDPAAQSTEGTAVWYMMDEVGTRISHCGLDPDDANVRCIPFFYFGTAQPQAQAQAYSLFWPVKEIEEGSLVERDFFVGLTTDFARAVKAIALGWMCEDELVSTEEESEEEVSYRDLMKRVLKQHQDRLKSIIPPSSTSTENENDMKKKETEKKKLSVYSDIDFLCQALTWSEEFGPFVERPEEADVVWYGGDMGEVEDILARGKPGQMINQFPNEKCITYKHLLVDTVERCWGTAATWLPTTYNLNTQLPLFVEDYLQRKEKEEDDHWIVKPWNKGRGIEIFVTKDLAPIVRSVETGPKIVSKYLSRPALYQGRKFDLRFIILLRSVQPLEVYIYRMFWIRVGNKQYSLTDLHDYEKHFTVMNYSAFALQQILYTDFIRDFETEHKLDTDHNWQNVIQPKIYQMLKDVFVAAVQPQSESAASSWQGIVPPPNATKDWEMVHRCRAVYGADVMLDEHMNPVLLEMNFSPDCHRAVNYDPDFYNVVFTTLFKDDWKEDPVKREKILQKIVLV
ncbi:Tubulin--tyrosine ligase-like protein 12 [Balamuthia mandrillaris]